MRWGCNTGTLTAQLGTTQRVCYTAQRKAHCPLHRTHRQQRQQRRPCAHVQHAGVPPARQRAPDGRCVRRVAVAVGQHAPVPLTHANGGGRKREMGVGELPGGRPLCASVPAPTSRVHTLGEGRAARPSQLGRALPSIPPHPTARPPATTHAPG